MESKQGTLTLVGTPIGNSADITQRAVEALQNADVIACEDTRRSLPFLLGRGVKKPLVSYHKHNEKSGAEYLVQLLSEGKDVALITDAGMPGISDPGAEAVRLARSVGIRVTCAPGPTALTTALALAGIEGAFTFLGFLPEKLKDKRAILQAFKNVPSALVFYISPHDIQKQLDFLHEELGERKLTLAREITKMFEEVQEGVLGEIRIDRPRGEYVAIVHAPEGEEIPEPNKLLRALLASGEDKKSAIKEVAARCKLPRDAVYKMALDMRDERS